MDSLTATEKYKMQRMALALQHLSQNAMERDHMLIRIVTGDESSDRHFIVGQKIQGDTVS